MEDYLKEALEIVKAQAGVRSMSEDEIVGMVKKISESIHAISENREATVAEDAAIAPHKVIREKSITCLVCGKEFKLITKRHLATHGLTVEEYLEKFGYKKGTALASKALRKSRKKKMQEMRLWERRDFNKKE